jgi:hypothetical protein
MLYLRNTNQIQSLSDSRFGGVQRGTLSNITASVTSSCIDYEDSGFIDINDITGGNGPLYNYSLYDLSASVYITQSTTVSSASIDDLVNSTYLLNINKLGLFAYTQSILINCPAPPDLEIEYLLVGGGGKGSGLQGGGGGGFLSGSASVVWKDNLAIEVGEGATIEDGGDSYISSSIFGTLTAGGGNRDQSGQPQGNNAGLGYTGGTGGSAGGGGGGAGQTGRNAVDPGTEPGNAGIGGDGLQWLDGIVYAGGGGGGSGNPGVISNAFGGSGGGGTGTGNDPYPTSSVAVDGLGGGAGAINGNGGSGIAIIRYSTGSVRPAYGGVVTEVGGYVYHTFTGSGDFRYAKI